MSIRDVQQEELRILKAFDHLCRLNGLNYQLFAGTLLGAIRHKGFIPWDDDIDVCMPRSDYERLLRVAKAGLGSEFFLQTTNTDPAFIWQFAKIRLNDTRFIERYTQEFDIHHGVFIDVFPLDRVDRATIMGKFHWLCLTVMSYLNLVKCEALCRDIRNPIRRCVALALRKAMLFVPKRYFEKMLWRLMTVFNSRDTKFVSHLSNGVNASRFKRYTVRESDIWETIEGEFEGSKFPIPKNFHVVLSSLFGEYMALPPESKRQPHHGVIEIQLSGLSRRSG